MQSSTQDDKRLMTIVAAALNKPAPDREAFLQQACGGDQALYAETLDAVRWEERMGTFLRKPMIDFRYFARPFEIGQVVSGRFEIVREIGEGGMGVVYEAFDRKRKHRIAIKAAKPGFQRLLSPELEGALKVRHPNICLVNEIHTAQTEFGEVDFLTMELLEGESLSVRLSSKGKLNEKDAIEIARQLCAGIAEAHRSGIIHRDLKSANVILSPGEGKLRVVITDFGLSGAMAMENGELAGTPAYMAPELWSGEKASKASDIYSLGMILYEVVTGRLPVDSKSGQRSNPLVTPSISDLDKSLSPRWNRVISKCLASVPDARPRDAAQVFAALEGTRIIPRIAMITLVIGSVLLAAREPLLDLFRPASVRLAVLPIQGENVPSLGGVVHDVADRVSHLRLGNRTVAVMPPSDTRENGMLNPQQAKQLLHATHALQTNVKQDGSDVLVRGAIIDLNSEAHVRDFTWRYSPNTLGNLPNALASEVSLALKLRGAAPEVISPRAAAPYDEGLYLMQTDRQSFERTIALFEDAARLDLHSALPLAGLVEAELVKFDITKDHRSLEEAERFLRAAESLNPDSARVRLAAGLLNETIGQYGRALEDYRRVQELEPRSADAFLRIAKVYSALDMPEQALQAFQKAIELDRAYFMPYEELGEFYFYRGKYPEAAEQFQNTIDRAPGIVYAHTNLGSVLIDLGRYKEGEKALKDSLQLQESARALNSLGASRAYQKRDAEALPYFERAVALDPHDFVYVVNLADCNRRLGQFSAARAAYRKTMDLILGELRDNPRLGYQRAFLGYVAARLGDRERAGDEITQALQLAPGDNKVIRKAVETYETLGDRDRAIVALEGATQELLGELDREPNLVEFRLDSRFRDLVDAKNGGK